MVVDILERVVQFGEETGNIKWTTIGILDKSCCSKSTIEVIDFDHFKTEFQKKKQVQHYKSCDALKIVNLQLDFIEMKGFKNRFKNPNVRPEKQKIEKTTTDIIDFRLSDKLRDSLLMWDTFIREKDLLNGKEVQQLDHNLTYQYIILTDIEPNSLEWLALNFTFFSEYNSNLSDFLTQKLENELQNIDKSLLHRIQKLPILTTCATIEMLYL